MKILLVDDDPVFLELLKNTLRKSGHEDVTLAETAEQAAQIIVRADPPFQCMFIDMVMPGADGDDLCYWARQFPEYEKTPIVMVTRVIEKSGFDRAFAAGATDYVTKPVNLPEFVFLVEQIKLGLEKAAYRARRQAHLEMPSDRSDRVGFSEPMKLGKIPGEIALDAMEKYLRRLGKMGIRDLDAFSVVIKDAAQLHFLCPRDAYISVLHATGLVIARTLPVKQYFLSYAGYGAFVGVAAGLGESENARDEIEHRIQKKLSSVQISRPTGGKIGIAPYMSLPKKLKVWQDQKAVDALYRAIGDAEERCYPVQAVA